MRWCFVDEPFVILFIGSYVPTNEATPTGPAFLKGCSESEKLEADKTCKKYLGDSVADLVTHNPLGKQLQLVASGFQLSTCEMWSWNCQKVHKRLPFSLSCLVLFGHEKKIVVLFQDFFNTQELKILHNEGCLCFCCFPLQRCCFDVQILLRFRLT